MANDEAARADWARSVPLVVRREPAENIGPPIGHRSPTSCHGSGISLTNHRKGRGRWLIPDFDLGHVETYEDFIGAQHRV